MKINKQEILAIIVCLVLFGGFAFLILSDNAYDTTDFESKMKFENVEISDYYKNTNLVLEATVSNYLDTILLEDKFLHNSAGDFAVELYDYHKKYDEFIFIHIIYRDMDGFLYKSREGDTLFIEEASYEFNVKNDLGF